ncbi:MAG: alpha/beta hydrolase [Mycobacterium sp.]|nr:alpha/beta hydrolase [Mycobacterium sp.]
MSVSLPGVVTVLLPGTGSDEDYLQRAFTEPLGRVGAIAAPIRPRPRDLVAGYLDAMSEAAADRGIIVGGVSLGAVVAARWALANPDRAVGVIAALPPWTGAPGAAPAAVSATYTAAELRRTGLAAVTAQLRRSSPGWLADELSRSWRRQWPDLPHALDAAAACTAPTTRELEHMQSPMGVVGAPDDLIHPVSVATEWARAAPRAVLRTVRLDRFGPDPEVLGTACVEAFIDALAVKPRPVC